MSKDEKKTHSKFHRDQTNVSWFKIEGTNFEILVNTTGGSGGEIHLKFQKTAMEKDEKKTHNKFYRDQKNESWFKIAEANC